MKRPTALLLCLVTLLCTMLTGCADSSQVKGKDLMSGVETSKTSTSQQVDIVISGEASESPTDFAVRLFRAGMTEGENSLLSPISVLYALAMTANGANGDTLAQMESVLGMPVAELNEYLKAYAEALPESEKYKLSIANSIWLTDDERFTVEQAFLQANADYYGAGIYQVPFNDDTCDDINDWVEAHTDGMIEDILDEIPADAVMYLVNALVFDAEWREIYFDHQVQDGKFTTETGEVQDVELMHSTEYNYLEDDLATGFLKYYADSKYAFAALLPNEGFTVSEYLDSLTGEGLTSLLTQPQETIVYAAIPKFESEYSTELRGVLTTMGMPDAFDPEVADFSGLGQSTDGNIFISRVLHKTFIAVDEKGTKAGAGTVVEAADEAAMMPEEPKEVILDRPFVYLLIDCETKLPLFIGTMMDMDD